MFYSPPQQEGGYSRTHRGQVVVVVVMTTPIKVIINSKQGHNLFFFVFKEMYEGLQYFTCYC